MIISIGDVYRVIIYSDILLYWAVRYSEWYSEEPASCLSIYLLWIFIRRELITIYCFNYFFQFSISGILLLFNFLESDRQCPTKYLSFYKFIVYILQFFKTCVCYTFKSWDWDRVRLCYHFTRNCRALREVCDRKKDFWYFEIIFCLFISYAW